MPEAVRVDVWLDLVCPFCWIGKRHLDAASQTTGIPVELRVRAFELDPTLGPSQPLPDHLARKFGGAARADAIARHVVAMGEHAGLSFRFDDAIAANTFAAHRLLQWAQAQGKGAPVAERLMQAHFLEGADLADAPTLERLARECGLEGAADALRDEGYAQQVREDELAARGFGVSGVPFFVLSERYGVQGAQPVEVFAQALREAAKLSSPR